MRSVSRWLPIIGGAIAGGVIALIIASASSSTKTVTTTVVQQGTSTTSAEPTSFKGGTGLSINQIYKAASPGVVDILVTAQSQQGQGFGFFGGQGGVTEGEGAGVVYNSNGDILTDEHVVANATSVKVNFQDGKSVPAKVLGTDPSTDVAVIHVDVPSSELHPIPLADSTQAQVGDPVVAIGSPFSLPETTTTGIVSQTGRSIQAPNGFRSPARSRPTRPSTPATRAARCWTPTATCSASTTRSRPTTRRPAARDRARASGSPSRPTRSSRSPTRSSTATRCSTPSSASASTAANNTAQIATTASSNCPHPVSPGSPAARAGLQPGDTVTAINGTPIATSDAFIATVDGYKPGQTVTMTVKHAGQSKQVKVTLGNRPAQTPSGG